MNHIRQLMTTNQYDGVTRRVRCLLILIVSFYYSASVYSESSPITLYASEYPPFYASQLPQQGVITEIVRTAFNRVEQPIDVEFLPFRRGLQQIQQGQADGMFALWYSDERAKQLWFSDTIVSNDIVLLRRLDDLRSFDRHNLHGLRIGNVRGYLPPDIILQQNLPLNEVSIDNQLLMMLIHDRLDVIIIDRWVANHLIATEMPEILGHVVAIEPPLERKSMHIVLSKTRANSLYLLELVNQVLQQLQEEGVIADILRRHGFEHDLVMMAAKNQLDAQHRHVEN